MASEGLYVPEEHLRDVIRVLRVGLGHVKVKREVSRNLLRWCREEEAYLERMAREEA